jgi:predicted porin
MQYARLYQWFRGGPLLYIPINSFIQPLRVNLMRFLLLLLPLLFITLPVRAEMALDLGGYFKGYLGYVAQDDDAGEPGDNTRALEWKREAEVTFSGKTTLDNNVTLGFVAELNAGDVDTSGSQFDEAYVYAQDHWGRINLGASDGVAELLQVAAPSADSNIDGKETRFIFINRGDNRAMFDYEQSTSGNADKVSYLTPKLSGFQAGLSYSPEVEEKPIDDRLSGISGDNNPGDVEHLIEIAARLDGEWSDIGYAIGAGYAIEQLEATGGSPVLNDDPFEANLGGRLTMGKMGLGAAYFWSNNGRENNGDDAVWFIGSDYRVSPNVTLGLSYLDSERETGADQTDEFNRWTAGGTFRVGKGLSFRGTVNYFDLDSDANPTTGSNDAISVLMGTNLSF